MRTRSATENCRAGKVSLSTNVNVPAPVLCQFAEPEAQQDAVFHPGVDHPAPVDLLGGADLALRECVPEFEKCRARFRIMLDLAQRARRSIESFRDCMRGKYKGNAEVRSQKAEVKP